jgi:Holliday junction resolvasome RuvABC endonuclease subunit
MTTLAVDPGSRVIGWAVLDGRDLVSHGVFWTEKVAYERRIPIIIDELDCVATEHHVDDVACERAFRVPGHNTAALEVSVRAITSWAKRLHLPFSLYSPGEWKASLTGSGAADKGLVEKMVCLQYRIAPGQASHVYDAIGIGAHDVAIRKLEGMSK